MFELALLIDKHSHLGICMTLKPNDHKNGSSFATRLANMIRCIHVSKSLKPTRSALKEKLNAIKSSPVDQLLQGCAKSESSFRLTSLLESLMVGSWIWNIKTNELIWDDSMYKLFGISQDSFSGAYSAWENSVHPDDREKAVRELQDAASGKAPFNTRFRVVLPSGDIRHVYAKASLTHDVDGSPHLMSGLTMDVTAAVLADEERVTLERKATRLLQAITIGFWELDVSTNFLIFDDAMYELYGLNRDDFPSALEANEQAIHPDDRQNVLMGTLDRIAAGDSIFNIEFRIVLPNGCIRHIHAKIFVERTTEGLPIRISGVDHDISDQRAAEYQRQQTYAAIDASALVLERDSDGKIIRANDNFCKAIGFSQDEIIAAKSSFGGIGNFVDPNFKDRWETLKKGNPWFGEICARRKDGLPIWMQAGTTPILNESGKIERYLSVRFDISDQVRMKQELLASKEKLSIMLESVQIGISMSTPTGEIIEINSFCLKMFGFKTKDELLRAGLECLYVNIEDRKSIYKTLQESGKVQGVEVKFKRKDKSTFWGSMSAVRCYAADGSPATIVSIVDITQQRLVAAQLLQASKLAALGEMSAGIAHEIRNPIAIVMGSAQVLKKFAGDAEKQVPHIDAISNAAHRVTRIIDGLRFFSRSTEDKVKQAHSLGHILRESINLSSSQAKRYGTLFLTEIKTNGLIVCDEVEISQVLINLFSNSIAAVKDLPERWIKVTLEEVVGEIILKVADSGPRISEEISRSMFNPFFTTKPAGEGTGLGLSISKTILDRHGATIELCSDVPNTCFEIRFTKSDTTHEP